MQKNSREDEGKEMEQKAFDFYGFPRNHRVGRGHLDQ